MSDAEPEFQDPAPNRARLVGPLFTEISEPVCDGARALFDLWQDLRPKNDLPNRTDFTIERIRDIGLLGAFFVIEPIAEGRDWRYRLMGSKIVWLFGRDVTNIPFSEHFYPDEAERCIALSNEVARSRRPLFLLARFVSGGYTGTLETMSLPVWSPQGEDIWLVGASFPDGEAVRRVSRSTV